MKRHTEYCQWQEVEYRREYDRGDNTTVTEISYTYVHVMCIAVMILLCYDMDLCVI